MIVQLLCFICHKLINLHKTPVIVPSQQEESNVTPDIFPVEYISSHLESLFEERIGWGILDALQQGSRAD